MNPRDIFSGLLLVVALNVQAGELRISSPVQQVGLLELYTSEGCSSCPPADRWLSELTTNDELWTRVVPVAFHVDYWDYLGWRDRFSAASSSNRQREYSLQGAVSTVYTPGLIYNGSDRYRRLGPRAGQHGAFTSRRWLASRALGNR